VVQSQGQIIREIEFLWVPTDLVLCMCGKPGLPPLLKQILRLLGSIIDHSQDIPYFVGRPNLIDSPSQLGSHNENEVIVESRQVYLELLLEEGRQEMGVEKDHERLVGIP
jgi:hypothetical protein